jgi:hypothetical protein
MHVNAADVANEGVYFLNVTKFTSVASAESKITRLYHSLRGQPLAAPSFLDLFVSVERSLKEPMESAAAKGVQKRAGRFAVHPVHPVRAVSGTKTAFFGSASLFIQSVLAPL